MRVVTFAVIFILMAMYLIIGVAWEVFSDRAIRTKSLFLVLLAGTIVTGLACMALPIGEVPD